MTQAAAVAQYVTAAAFVGLAVAIAYRWYRQPGRAQGMLALAIVSLGFVAAIGRLQDPGHPSTAVSVLSVVLFLASGFFVLLFRHELIPLSRSSLVAAYVLLAVSIVVGVVDVVALANVHSLVATLATLVIIGAWAVFTGEPIVRFWLASNSLPAVQRARLRFLSAGFAVLIGVLFLAVAGGSAQQSPAVVLVTQLLALLAVPAIYVSFAPPSLLRRIWRMAEESEVRAAIQDLLVFSPSRKILAERASYWAVRLMGAVAGYVIDADGKVLATAGIEPDRVEALQASVPAERIISAPMHLGEGEGTLAIVGGPFTPVYGSDELVTLRAYASSVSAGLDRARVTERMAAIETNKTQFLNLASHELRGPVTVIRGYVSMLEGGMLGHLNERGRKAATVMSAKISEMNELIEEMIEAARLEDGGLSLRLVEADLRDVVKAAAESVSPLVDGSHRLVLDLPDRRVKVRIDTDRTRTIVANLMNNALKYSPNGGDVTCQVRSRAGIARVAVSDEGLGIALQNMPILFTRFGRVITPETEHLKGTGLGLFLGRQLARMQGGDITVSSSEGKGSTFTLHLPVGAAQSAAANGAAAAESGEPGDPDESSPPTAASPGAKTD